MINISLHIQKLPPATLGVGGTLESNTQSAKICLNFNFRRGGDSGVKYSKCKHLPKFQFLWRGGYSGAKYSKCQDLPKFQFSEGRGDSGVKYSKCKHLPKFQFSGGGGRGYSGAKYSKCQDLPKFQWGEGYSGVKYSKCQDLTKFQFLGGDTNLLFEFSVQKPARASQIVSHILRIWRLTRNSSKYFQSILKMKT